MTVGINKAITNIKELHSFVGKTACFTVKIERNTWSLPNVVLVIVQLHIVIY